MDCLMPDAPVISVCSRVAAEVECYPLFRGRVNETPNWEKSLVLNPMQR